MRQIKTPNLQLGQRPSHRSLEAANSWLSLEDDEEMVWLLDKILSEAVGEGESGTRRSKRGGGRGESTTTGRGFKGRKLATR